MGGLVFFSHTNFGIFFLIQLYSLVGLYFCLCNNVTTNQISVNDGFEVEKSKFIWVHNVVENEAASRGYIRQAEKNMQVETN